jgi:hypothetical protein
MDTILTNFSVKFFIAILTTYPLHLLGSIIVLRLLYNKFCNGISRIPGPTLASWSGLWRLYDVSKGDAHNTAIKLHKKHGKLVRIGPKHISVGDPAAIQTIYGLKTGFTKVCTSFSFISSMQKVFELTWREDRLLPHPVHQLEQGAPDEPLLHPRSAVPPRPKETRR